MAAPRRAAKNPSHRPTGPNPTERDMARMNHGHDDRGDKAAAIRTLLSARGMDPRDFDIEDDARSGISQLLGLAGGIVSLRRRSTGEIRVYAAGPGSAWFAALCADLDRGYFRAATPASAFRRPTPAAPLMA
jgi:hypothetical protein